MVGFIDGVSGNRLRLHGWVSTAADGTVPTISAWDSKETIGHGNILEPRQDVRSATGLDNRSYVVTLNRAVSPVSVLGGSLRVIAQYPSGQVELPLSSGGRSAETEAALIELAGQVRDPSALFSPRGADYEKLKNYDSEVNRAGELGKLSPLLFPIGYRSKDNSARLGLDGHLFLTGGSNALLDRYRPPNTNGEKQRLESDSIKWADLINERNRKISEQGASFVQIIIPEKLTAMRHLAPMHIAGPTPLLARLSELLGAETHWVSGVDIFEKWVGPLEPWQRNDSHCSPAGSLAIVRCLISRMPGIETTLLNNVPLSHAVYRDGDLSERFFGTPLWDKHLEPEPSFLAKAGNGAVRVHDVSPEKGVVGTHRVWKNSCAPIPKRVVVFGNSFFGASADTPAKLGWWFARLFSEYHLIWTPNIDYSYVARIQPEYVIAQTVERFIGRLPES